MNNKKFNLVMKNVFVLFAVLIFFSAMSIQAEQLTRIGSMTISCGGAHDYFTCPETGLYRVIAESGAIQFTTPNYWSWNSKGTTQDAVVLNGRIWSKIGCFRTMAEAEAYWKGTYIDVNMSAGNKLDIYFSDPCYGDNAGSATVGVYSYIEGADLLGSSKKNPERDVAKDPINVTNGNLYSIHQDISIPAKGLPLEFTRTYNSRDDYNTVSGYGWTHSSNIILKEEGIYVEIKDGEGARCFYVKNEDETYSSPAGEYGVLVKNADDTYALTKKHGTKYNFSSSGKLTSIADRNNNTQTLSYSGDLLTQITDSSGKILTIFYNADNRISEVSDPAERTVAYDYDADGNLISVTDQDGNITTYAYDEYHNLVTITDPEGHSSHFTYDMENDRCVSFSYDNDINKVTLSYDPENMKTTVTDFKGNASIYEYNNDGVVTKITDPEGNEKSWTWDENINRTSSTDANGNTTLFEYDERGNLTKIKGPKGNETIFTYETDFDMCASITDALTQATNYTYDDRGNLIQVENANKDATIYTYDSSGNLLATKDANNHVTQYEYDTYGNLIKVIDPLNNETQFEYDISGNCTTLTDAKENETKYTYDILNRLTSVIASPEGLRDEAISYTYDKVSNRTSVTDPLNRITNYSYDPANKLLGVIDALQNKTTYSYDTEGNRTSVEDASNNVTAYEYDNLNRVVSVGTGLAPVRYTYDATGNRVSMTDAKGNKTVYIYDKNNRLIKTGVIEDIQNVRTWDSEEDFESGIGENINTEAIPGSVCLEQIPITFHGDAQLDTAQKKFGTASLLLDGTGDYLSLSDSSDWVLGTGDFTVDLWAKIDTLTKGRFFANFIDIGVYLNDANPNQIYAFGVGPFNWSSDTAWHHWAFVRSGTDLTVYVDGITKGTLTCSTDFSNSDGQNIGALTTTNCFDGHIDEFRFSKGIARWTSSFTPPTEKYSTDTYTKLLLHLDGEDGATSTEDSSKAFSGSLTLGYDAGSAETFGSLDITASTPQNTSIRARIKAADTIEDMDSASWSNWYSSFPVNFVKTGRFARVEVSLSTQDPLVTPVLESISLNKVNLSSVVNFTYDELGRRTSMTDTTGTTTYEYDNLNRLVSVGTGLAPVRYDYDAVGNRISMTDQNDGVTTYQYDELNRLVSLTSPDEKVTNYTYDTVSNLTNMSLPNNTQVNYQFDNLNRLINLTNKKNSGDKISSFNYDYNLAGMRNKVTLADGSYVNYSYDDVNRLTEEAKYSSSGNLNYSDTYEFDSVGNRTGKTNNAYGETTYTYNSENQLVHEYRMGKATQPKIVTISGTVEDESSTTVTVNGVAAVVSGSTWSAQIELSPGENTVTVIAEDAAGNKASKSITLILADRQSIDYAYDDSGNLVSKTDSSGTTQYSWDSENRLVGIIYPDGTEDVYTYDGVGKRIQTSEDGNITNYLYDGLNVIIEQDGSGLTTASYVRGLGYGGGIGSVISKQGAEGSKQYYYYDGIGNVVNLADNAGNVTQSYVYDAYGNVLNGAVPSPHGFSTKEYSSRSGLIHFGARLYDPAVGRFISKDPLGMIDGPNMYSYVNNNPVNLVDPYGLCAQGTGSQQPTPLAEQVKPRAPLPRIEAIKPFSFKENVNKLEAWLRNRSLLGTTAYGASAQDWYIQQYLKTGNSLYHIGGLTATLWTPETWYKTGPVMVAGGTTLILLDVNTKLGILGLSLATHLYTQTLPPVIKYIEPVTTRITRMLR